MLDRISAKSNSVEHLLLQSIRTQLNRKAVDIEVDSEYLRDFAKLHKILINFNDSRVTQQDYLQLNTLIFRIQDMNSDVAKYFINSFIRTFTERTFHEKQTYPIISINIKK